MYKLGMLFWNIFYRIKELPLLFKGKISFNNWLNLNINFNVWIYTGLDYINGNKDGLGYDFDVDNEEMGVYGSNMKLIGKNRFKLKDGSVIYNAKHKGTYIKKGSEFIPCEIQNEKLIPVPNGQIILDFPKTQIIRLTKKAKEKNLSLKDYLLQQINSIL